MTITKFLFCRNNRCGKLAKCRFACFEPWRKFNYRLMRGLAKAYCLESHATQMRQPPCH